MENLEDSLLGRDDEEIDDEVDLDEDALLGSETDDLVDEFGENLNDKEEDVLDIVLFEPLDDLESNEFDFQSNEDLHVELDGLDESNRDVSKNSSSPDGSSVDALNKNKDGNINYKYKDNSDEVKISQKGRFPKERYSTQPLNRNFRSNISESTDCLDYRKRPSRYCGRKDDYWPRNNVKRGYPFDKGSNLRRPSWSPKPPQKIHINPHFKSKLIPPEGWHEPFSLPHVLNDVSKQDYSYPKNNTWDAPRCPSSTFQPPPPFNTPFNHPPPPIALSICHGPPPISEMPPVSLGVSPYHYPVLNDSRPSITPMHIPPPTYYSQREPSFSSTPPIYNTEPPVINVMQPEAFNQLISRPPPMGNLDSNYNQKLPSSPVTTGNYHARHDMKFTGGHPSRYPDPYPRGLSKGPRQGPDSSHHKSWRGERVGWKTKFKAKQSAVTNSNLHTIKTVELPRRVSKDLKDDERQSGDILEESRRTSLEDNTENKLPVNTCEVNPEEDEQTKELRKEIEIQKRLREELIEKKEARRKAAIMVLQKQADNRNSCPTSQQGAGDAPVVTCSGDSDKDSNSEANDFKVLDVNQSNVIKHSGPLSGNYASKVDNITVKTTFQ